jgi:outer membrane protein, protease secretion system
MGQLNPAQAQAREAPLDLQTAWSLAQQYDAQVRAAQAAVEVARERVPQARAQLLPQVAASVGRTWNNLDTKTLSERGEFVSTNSYPSSNAALTARQPLYRPFARAQLKQAEAQVADAQAQLDREQQSLLARLADAYFNVLLGLEQRGLVAAQKAATQAQLDAARRLLSAGAGVRTDVDDAQARMDLLLAQELEVEQQLLFVQRQLATMVGQPVAAVAALDVNRFAPAGPQPSALEAWIERAAQNSPELAALRAQREAARLEVDKARTGHLPTADLQAQWSRSKSDSVNAIDTRYLNRSIGVQVQVPLYAGGAVNAQVRQAAAGVERVDAQIDATERDLQLRLMREHRGMTEGILRVKAYEQAVRSAEQSVTSNRRSFEAGRRTTLDVLSAQAQLAAAQRDLAQARLNYMVSSLRLSALAGDDLDATVRGVNAALTATPAAAGGARP